MEKNNLVWFPVILVDDEAQFREVTARRLKKKGFNPIESPGGKDCLNRLETLVQAVVVLDVKMPGMDGMETLKAIKHRFPETQVILLTGNAAISDGIEGIKAGAFDYLTKPVDLHHLMGKIRQAFEMIGLAREKDKERARRKKLEQKMVEAERLMALGTMSTGIAHEINNPLAIINEAAGFMKLVLTSEDMKDGPGKDALINGIGKIEKSVKRARKITHQLLGQVKPQDFCFTSVDMVPMIHETFELMDKKIQDKKIQVDWKDSPRSCVVSSDPDQVRQLLINLFDNAVHSVGEKGKIQVSVTQTPPDMILKIEDNGRGIAPEHIHKIFEPFFTTKTFDQGTGLGLFVVHQIIKRLKGDIDVESRIGRGTAFYIKLPLAGSE